MVNRLFQELSMLEQVTAITLGGSRAGSQFDEKSDYDVYLYCTAPVAEDIRRAILEKYCSYMELGNQFWEYEDNVTLKDGVDMDILYRNLEDFTRDVSSVVEACQPRNGYTTCMWHNLNTCKILYDPIGALGEAKRRFAVPYPQKLKAAIIERNRKLLHGTLPAYDGQIRKAVSRADQVSIHHRVTAFLESYFDILFARNEVTHPGEKRLMSLCRQLCPVLPAHFEENLNRLFSHMYAEPERIGSDLDAILLELEKIL